MTNLVTAPTHEPGELIRSYRMDAPNLPETAKVARDMVAALLRATEHPALVDVGRLLVSEVVTNVHLHARVPQLTLEATVRSDRVRVAVLGADPCGVPQIRKAIADAEGGRGLPLVQHFAAAWGTTRRTRTHRQERVVRTPRRERRGSGDAMISALLFGIVGFTVGASIVAIAFSSPEHGVDRTHDPRRKS